MHVLLCALGNTGLSILLLVLALALFSLSVVSDGRRNLSSPRSLETSFKSCSRKSKTKPGLCVAHCKISQDCRMGSS